MADAGLKFFGCGELVYDHLIEVAGRDNREKPRYLGGRGGGSVWNAIVNLAFWDFQCAAIGHSARDAFADFARRELAFFEVNTKSISNVSSKSRTRLFFEYHDSTHSSDEAHWFSGHCPVCRGGHEPGKYPNLAVDAGHFFDAGSVLILDTISRPQYLQIAQRAKEAAALCVAIIGHPSMYRYVPIAELMGRLLDFDFVFMDEAVFLSFDKRGVRAGFGGLLDLFAQQEGARILVVTRGKGGAELYVRSERGKVVTVRAPALETRDVLDTAGAGDALCAAFLAEAGRDLRQIVGEKATTLDEACWTDLLSRATTRVQPVLHHVGARGHLPPEDDRFGFGKNIGRTIEEMRLERGIRCPLCLAQVREAVCRDSKAPSSRRPGMRENARAHLHARALFSLESGALAKARDLVLASEPSRTYVIGTGGSYPAAIFIAYYWAWEASRRSYSAT
jgi:sugar/nucleoside kinase (ribokinase family)